MELWALGIKRSHRTGPSLWGRELWIEQIGADAFRLEDTHLAVVG